MMYQAYQFNADFFQPFRLAAQEASAYLGVLSVADNTGILRRMAASCEVMARAHLNHSRPSFDIDSVMLGNTEVAVVTEPTQIKPFGTLLHFKKLTDCDFDEAMPKILVVAPLSGHFATLLRSTIKTLLVDHDVYVTDWHNARDVPLTDGNFTFESYVDYIIEFLETLGPGSHVLGVCQPCVQVLMAVAVMAEDGNPCTPRSMTLMAGPVDTRIHPTKVNELAMSKPMSWFDANLISLVPYGLKGAGRRVYPGFLQLSAFLSMNMERHKKAHQDLYDHLAHNQVAEAQAIKSFYDEYFAVLDLPADFYLETVDLVFQRALLAKGEMTYRGRLVDPKAIRRTALLTVEGERDDICALGQTSVAHDLCPSIKPFMRRHHMQVGVGHYGVFSGKRWEHQIYPLVRNMILSTN
jgi:poly(3-hydroxybutyrate) depolymerase